MAGFSILAKLGLDSSKFASELKSQDTAMSKFGKAIGTAVKAGAAIAATAFAAFTVKGIKDLVDFDKKMNEVFTLLPGITEESMGKMKTSVRDLAKTMGVDLGDATSALYQAISAGVPKENVFEFMEIAAKASVGGVTSLETAVDGITTAVNTYGAANLSAKDAADSMFTAVKLGKTTFEELSGALFNVLPMAKQAGVSFDSISAALAVMTSKGTPTTVATTQLRAALTSLIAPTAKTAKAFSDYGLDVGNLKALMAGGEGGLVKAMQNVMVATEGDETAIRKLLGSTEAMNAVLTLTAGGAKSFGDAMDEMGRKTGATDTAFQTMEQSVAHQMNKMMGSLKDLGMSVGNVFLPMINAILPDLIKAFNGAVGPVDQFAKKFPDMVRDVGDVVKKFVKFAAILATFVVTARTTSALMGAWATATKLFSVATIGASAAMKKLNVASKANIIGLVAAAAVTVALAFKQWKDSEEELHKVMRNTPEFLKSTEKAAEDAYGEYVAAADEVGKLTEELAELNRQEGLKESGVTELQDALEIRKASLQVQKDELKLMEDGLEGELKKLDAARDKFKEELKTTSSKEHELLIVADLERVERDRQILARDILQKQIDIKNTENDILDIEKDRNKEIEDAKQVQLDTKQIIDDVHKIKMLEKTEVGKIHLLEMDIRDLEIQKKNLIDNSIVSRDLETGAAKDLETVEGNILAKRQAIEGIIKGALKAAQDAELLRIKDLVDELDKALKKEEKRAREAKDAAEAKEREVANLRKDLKKADEALEPLKKFFKKDLKGEVKINTAETRREFEKLKKAGQLPKDVESLRDFQNMLTDQKDAGLIARDQIIKNGKIAKDDAETLRVKEFIANQEAIKTQKKIDDEKERILNLEKEAEDKEKKTLEELTAERVAWQKALKDWEEKLNLIPPAEKTLANALNNQSGSLRNIDAGVAALLGKDLGGTGYGGGSDSGSDAGVEIDLPIPADGDKDNGVEVELPAPGGGDDAGEVELPAPADGDGKNGLALEETQQDVLDTLQGFFVNQ